jgi:polyvinyl alcohol dehydrogenase (cytochrome)
VRRTRLRWCLPAALACALVAAPALAQAPDGSSIFADHCAACHAAADRDPRVPALAALRQFTPESIVQALTSGAMRDQGAALSNAERTAVAAFLAQAAAAPGRPARGPAGRCAEVAPFDAAGAPAWNGWGADVANTRFQPAAQAGLTAAEVPRLTLKWAFGFPEATSARALPTVAGGRVFVGSQSGAVYALDARTGCTIWTFQASSEVRSAIVLGPREGGGTTAYFGDGRAVVYALDADSGGLLWARKVEDHRSAHVTGAPTLYQGRLYVPIASGEEGTGGSPQYECCTFRGSIVALDAAAGTVAWKTYTIPETPIPIGKNAAGATRWGPSGAGIWSAPTIDAKRRLLYAATGNMYTEPQHATSDAVLAFDLNTGRIVWSKQVTPVDVFVVGCGARPGPNCPEDVGPDADFGNSPILATLPDGRDLIVIGQKSGVGWALDPDKQGAVVWQYRAGRGSALGGMEFGSAVDRDHAYFPVADGLTPTPGGLHAVDLATGQRAWYAPPPPPACSASAGGGNGRGCNAALLAAISVVPGAVFAGSNDGAIRAYATGDGSLLWAYDTNRAFDTVNGVSAHGASINGPGPVVAGGMVYVNSGYGAFGGRPGNVLLAFGVE